MGNLRAMLRMNLSPARRLASCRAGVAAIEMAFLAPVLVFIAVGVVDFGLGIYTKMQVNDAAEAGAAWALINNATYSSSTATAFNQSVTTAAQTAVTLNPLLSSNGLQAQATEQFCCVGMTQCGATQPSCSNSIVGTYVQVTTSANYSTFLPYSYLSQLFSVTISNPVTLSSVATVRIQ